MRYYPFGSGSIPFIVLSSSNASYATETDFGIMLRSASRALSSSQGTQGPMGGCIYQKGPIGAPGPVGPQGPVGTVFGPV